MTGQTPNGSDPHLPPDFGLVTIGINYQTAGAGEVARYSLGEDEVSQVLGRCCGRFREALVVATCNRTEVTVLTAHSRRAVRNTICSVLLPNSDAEHALPRGFFEVEGREVVRHLFSLAAGMESLLVGEQEILGQVRRAAELSRRERVIGPVLSELSRRAVAAGRRVRRETTIESEAASLSHALVAMAKAHLGSLDGAAMLVIGAGQAARAVLNAFREEPLGRRMIANRTRSRALELAAESSCEVMTLSEEGVSAADPDVVVLATPARNRLEFVGCWAARLPTRPRALFDLGPPAGVRPGDSEVTHWSLKDIQREALARSSTAPAVLEQAGAIIDEEVSAFFASWEKREVAPVVKALLVQAQSMSDEQVNAALKSMGPITDAQEEAVRYLARSIVKKLLHVPLTRITDPANGRRAAGWAVGLFGLEEIANGEGRR